MLSKARNLEHLKASNQAKVWGESIVYVTTREQGPKAAIGWAEKG